MILRLCVILALLSALSACGTKSELLRPDGKQTAKDEKDPSQPPSPIAR